MARKWKLTWQKGADRRGRWKKIYRGRTHYFDGGGGKTDSEGYRRAMEEWQRLKIRLDAEAETDKPHRAAYESAIAEWEAVQGWARERGDIAISTVAALKLEDLRSRSLKAVPPPLGIGDRPMRKDQLSHSRLLNRVMVELRPAAPPVSEGDATEFCTLLGIPDDEATITRVQQALARVLAAGAWQERVEDQRKKAEAVESDCGVGKQVEEYLRLREHARITAGGLANTRRHLVCFRDFVGAGSPVEKICSKTIDEWHGHLMAEIARERFTSGYAKNVQQTVRRWIRWLWERQFLNDLPRNLDTASHRILVELKPIKTASFAEVRRIYSETQGLLKLSLLLAVNCGMTQVDISDLRPDQIDWTAGTLTRKRGKTKHVGTVPTVVYPLWPETLALLRELRSDNAEHLLLAPNGGPLKYEVRKGDTSAKQDYVGQPFRRLMARLNLKVQFKSLKKTSASLLRDHKDYNGLEGLFLDHAPRSTSDRHYAAPPLKLFAEAIGWLRKQYRLEGS